VRLEITDRRERLAALGRGGDELQLGPFAHGALDALAEQRVIVGDHDPHTGRRHTRMMTERGRLQGE